MSNLPDLEGWAVFAKVAELRSFAGAAAELSLSKATVSKVVGRLETRLGARLFHRTARRLSLTEIGAALVERATRILAEAQAAEDDALAQSSTPRGRVRLAAPMSFGLAYVAPALPAFLEQFPEISVDLHLSDRVVDLIDAGIDVALRIAAMPDSSLVARRLCAVERSLVAAPTYLARHGRPTHPHQLGDHACLGYAYLPNAGAWRFLNRAGEEVSVQPKGPLNANNADALTPALLAGLGLAVQPHFVIWRDLEAGRLEAVMDGWTPPPIALHLVAAPGRPRPARVEALMEFLARTFAQPQWT